MAASKELSKHDNKTDMLFIFFGIWSFVLICRPQDYLIFLGYIRPNITLGFITLLSYLLYKTTDITLAPSSQLRRYLYLIGTIVISVPFSLYRRGSLMDLINYSSVIMFLFLFYRIINSTSKLRSLIFAYCSGITVYALYVLKSGSFTDDRLFFGGMFDPNDIAYYMLSFIALNLIFVTKKNLIFIRIISTIYVIIGIIVILKTGSRGGLIALIMVFVYLFCSIRNTLKISLVTKVVLIVVAVLSLQFVAINTERYQTITDLKSDYNVTDEEGRIAIWNIGMRLMFAHPFTGVGLNQFPHGVGKDREERGLASAKWHTAHNSLIQIGAETGLIGFYLFATLCFNAFKIFGEVTVKTKNEDLAQLGEMARAGFIGHFISAMFLSQAYSVYWAFYIVLSAVLKNMLDNEVNLSTAVK